MDTKQIILKVKNISKDYTDEFGYTNHLLEDISFEISGKQFTSILAPMNAGKSSLLKIIAGLQKQTRGEIGFNSGSNCNCIFIPAKPTSLPWLNVEKNIELLNKPGSGFNVSRDDITRAIKIVGLAGYEDHIPNNKSLGFRFRISLARALAAQAKLILLDEPFNHFEQTTKKEIYELLRAIHVAEDTSFILATSNISEAVFLSDNIILLENKPSRVLDDVKVDLPFNRNIKILTDESFQLIKKKIENTLKYNPDHALDSFLS
ncbi:MAG: ABC transporter ATP-binding protein [Ignavibacteriales bacterium]|nr:MAG: ABC transporter ATP-binding protein [Ignavibacteriales bacterium]